MFVWILSTGSGSENLDEEIILLLFLDDSFAPTLISTGHNSAVLNTI